MKSFLLTIALFLFIQSGFSQGIPSFPKTVFKKDIKGIHPLDVHLLTTISPEILYMGPYKSEVYLEQGLDLNKHLCPCDRTHNSRGLCFCLYRLTEWDSSNLSIRVDTKQCFTHFTQMDRSIYSRSDAESKVSFYPVMLYNHSSDTLNMGFGILGFVVEAKDSSDNWKPVERPMWLCAMGVTRFLQLLPGEMIISECFLYTGSYKTRLRLRYGDIISNEFNGAINYSQFIAD